MCINNDQSIKTILVYHLNLLFSLALYQHSTAIKHLKLLNEAFPDGPEPFEPNAFLY